MEGEKETAEEKEEEEEEDLRPIAAATAVDYLDFPIMHWEDLSQRIAELEKQEQERRERGGGGSRSEEAEHEDLRRCRVAQRYNNHRNLQLCFINNSDSEDEDDGSTKVSAGQCGNGCHAGGLKQEVAAALRALRDKLLAEQKKEHVAGSSAVAGRKHAERRELQECSLQQLRSLRGSLQQDVHALSSELVAQLLVRDQLRTKQDAMLLDVQDLT